VTWPSGGSGYGDNQAGGPDSSGPQGVPGYQQQQQPYGQQQPAQPQPQQQPQYPGYNYGQPQYPGYPQQQPQPQYQQQQPYQSNYGGFGMYQQPPQGPPPRNRRTLTIVLTLVGVLVLAGVVTTVVLLARGGQPQAGERTQQPSPTTTATRKPLDPRVPGWQVAVSNRRNVAYDVPKTQWTKDDPDAIAGMGPSDGDFVTGTGAAYYMKGYCAGQTGSVRAGTAVTANDTEGPDQSAPDTAKHWATVAYKSDSGQAPDVKAEPAKQIKISDGKVSATLSVADVTTPKSANPCTPPSAKVYAAAVKTSDTGSVILVLFADQGVPNALTDDDAMKIMTSMRPSG
jgi:hypothetical protein